MSLKKTASFLGEFKSILPLLLMLAACASKKTVTPEQRMQFLDQELEHTFKKPVTLKPSDRKFSRIKAGQWVTFSVHSKKKSQPSTFSTYKVIEVKKDKLKLAIETQTAESAQHTKIELNISGYENPPHMGMNLKERAAALNKVKIEKSTPPNPINEDLLKKIIFEGYRISEMRPVKCETENLKSSKCIEYNYDIDHVSYRSHGKIWVHSAIPLLGIFRAEDDASVIRAIKFGEDNKNDLKTR